MNRPTILFLLICSALFNLFFIAGAMMGWGQTDARPLRQNGHAAAVEQIVSEMGLDARQRDAFELLRIEFEEESEILDDQILTVKNKVSMELRNESPDLDALSMLMQEKTRLRDERRRAGSLRFEEFLEYLNPEQRRILAQRLDRHRSTRRPGHMKRMLEEFDHDGDGDLDPQEQQEADAMHEQRQTERRERREAMRKQFDVDGDGTLSREETKAFHDWMRTQRGNKDQSDRGTQPRDPAHGPPSEGHGPPRPGFGPPPGPGRGPAGP